jgi:hypothetical protein
LKREIEEYITSNWGSLGSGGQAPLRMSSLVISQPHGRDYDKGKMTHIVFAEGDEAPALVAKYCKSRAYEHSLKREVDASGGLEKMGLKGYAPEVAGTAEVDGREVLFLRPVQGMAISLQIRELAFREGWDSPELMSLVRDYFGLAAEYLVKLGSSDGDGIVVTNETLRDKVEPVISRYMNGLGIDGQERRSCEETLGVFEQLIGKKIRPRIVHGDFIPSNLFLAEGKKHLVAIDWEFASPVGLYSLDALRFLYYCYEDIAGAVIREEDHDAHFMETFVRRGNWYGELAFDFAVSVLGEFGLDYGGYKRLFAFSLMHEYGLQSDMARFPDIHRTASTRRRVNYLAGFGETGLTGHASNKIANEEENQSMEQRLDSLAERVDRLEETISSVADTARRTELQLARVQGSLPWRIYSKLAEVARRFLVR